MKYFIFSTGERVISLKNLQQANDCRDALAKSLYEKLFKWIVSQINRLLTPATNNTIYSNDKFVFVIYT